MDLPGEAFGPLYCGLCLAWLHVWEQVWKQFCSWGSWAWRPHEQSHHSKDCPQDSLLGSPPPLTLAICLARSNGGKEIVLPVPPKTQDLVKKNNPRMSLPDPQYDAALFYLLCILNIYLFVVIVVQWLSHIWLFATPWTAALQVSLSFTISRSLLKLMSIESVMPPNRLVLSPPSLAYFGYVGSSLSCPGSVLLHVGFLQCVGSTRAAVFRPLIALASLAAKHRL